ncbi:MAG: Mu transposase C-terminal domain-containing protein [Sphingomonadaceae bacterium]|nr:Mu transposase C-terminal domain-containing protein [Sphingomonadaceae bacterium]
MASRAIEQDEQAPTESRDWFTAAELAELALPGLPADKRSINRRARDERWSLRSDAVGEALSRPRIGRGGGTEFHISLLPGAARIELVKRGLCETPPEPTMTESPEATAWRWYEGQSAKVKDAAQRRAAIIAEIDLLEDSGLTRSAAVAESARRYGKSGSTVWNWLKLVDGIGRSDRLPALAPRHQGGGREAEIDPLLWNLFKSDFLRPSAPTLASCYDRVAAVAAERGLSLPSEACFRRRIKREIPPEVIKLRREGEEAVRRSLPSQRRSVDELHAMECVNIDGHKFDVFVRTPEGNVIRPVMVAIQDIYSSKFLAWRMAETESAVLTRLAFADLFQNFGIPKACVLDNGRAFASKWITGGAKSRFRFKIKEEEPTGILTALGINIHWALPYRGQSKPIERAFRDLCDTIAKHPAMEGAYTGNNPMAKPENYGSHAIEWDTFVAHVERGMAAHNAKLGRRGRNYRGRSFDDVFSESYASAPIGKASPEQLRMALLAADQVRVNNQTGEVRLFGNRYWSPECGGLHGQRVTVRFDPDNLMNDVHLYGQDGRYLTSAPIIADTGFLDAAGAKEAAKRLSDARKRIRAAADAEQLLAADEVARLQADAIAPDVPEPSVLRPVHHRGQTAAALKAVPEPKPPQSKPHQSRVFAALSIVKPAE